MVQFEAELKKLGLSDKEAAVYIACLQLGSSPAQQIARRAKVVRATTYVILESLMQRGLVTQYKEGKKTLFSAEPPRQLMRLLEKQIEDIRERQHGLEQILPELQVLMKATGGRPSVRYFEGIEGLRAMRQEMVMYSRSGDTWYNFTPTDHLNAVFGQDALWDRQRVAKQIRVKTIFSTKSDMLRRALLQSQDAHLSERHFIPPQYFSGSSGMTVFRDRIAIGSFVGKVGGVILDSESMADMMRSLFNLALNGLTMQGTENT